MKEVIHHLDENDRVHIFTGMRQELKSVNDDTMPSLLIHYSTSVQP